MRSLETASIAPEQVLRQVAEALPKKFRENVIIIGSLAAGYHFFRDDPKVQVRTKDVDCLLAPRIKAIPAGRAVAEQLFAENWALRADDQWGRPGDANTPLGDLPVVRLHPPGSKEWFIELLTVPESEHDLDRKDIRLETSRGHFSLCSFGFLSVAEHQPSATPFGIFVARPEMMALANLLHHPVIGAQTMKGLIGGRKIKRSNKDLGRVLALAWLSEEQEEDSVLRWSKKWLEALKSHFPSQWRTLAAGAGRGLRKLLESNHEPDLDEARHTCVSGLLASRPLTIEALRATGQRLIQDAMEPLALAAVRQYPARVSWLDNGVHDPTTEVTSYWVSVDDEKVRIHVSDEVTEDQTRDAIRAKVEELLIAAASSGSVPEKRSIRSADFVPGPQREEE